MDHDPAAQQATPVPTSIEPSRAWILGLVVAPDGTLTGPGPTLEWPECECPFDCAIDHENS
jgi:hypothetical protein